MIGTARVWLRKQVNDRIFRARLHKLLAMPASATPSLVSLERLAKGWDNQNWSAHGKFLLSAMQFARDTAGPILECGSGLSTILLGANAGRQHREIYALEHDTVWVQRVSKVIAEHRIPNTRVFTCALIDYGAYCWYDVSDTSLPHDFGLVICDGPPGDTKGGRSGLLPTMSMSLRKGCVVLLDDAQRPAEQAAIRQWSDAFGPQTSIVGTDRQYAVMRF